MNVDAETKGDFKKLFIEEQKWRHQHGVKDPASGAVEKSFGEPIFGAGNSSESPHVTFANEDCVGLAFSGGGIRSATFNLGVLQGLRRLKILAHFDYLSTVSGGGYIGAWWSAWLARRAPSAAGDGPFPKANGHNESPEVRHLREFSNFLAPRIGFFETETWAAVVAVLSALLPALAVALAVIASVELAWLGLAELTIHSGTWAAVTAMIAIVFLVELVCELRWCGRGKAEDCGFQKNLGRWFLLVALGLVASAAAWFAVDWARLGVHLSASWFFDRGRPFEISPRLGQAALAWTGAALVLFVIRILILRFYRRKTPPPSRHSSPPEKQPPSLNVVISSFDRVTQRLLAMSVVWIALTGVWLAGAWLSHRYFGSAAAAGGAAASGGAFALLRNWFIKSLSTPKKGGVDLLKPLLPQLLALVALILTAICIAALLSAGLHTRGGWFYAGALLGAVGVVGFAALFFDPAQVSMHAFYRNRLARAYLGASNAKVLEKGGIDPNREVDVREGDDIPMRELMPIGTGRKRGPLHLVCCAANDVGGDQLGNLGRASRSAVLSPLGFQIGNHWRAWNEEPGASATHIDRLTLASAITASAAAFNSNSGIL